MSYWAARGKRKRAFAFGPFGTVLLTQRNRVLFLQSYVHCARGGYFLLNRNQLTDTKIFFSVCFPGGFSEKSSVVHILYIRTFGLGHVFFAIYIY